MRKVLIVSPRFPPVSAPDLHRVRMSLPYFAGFGWEATVLCATPETTDGIIDPELGATVPASVRVERVPAWSERACRRLGFGHFNYRCLVPLYRRGRQILAAERFDAIYISTTSMLAFVLGRLWRRRFAGAIVLDYQDPWHAGAGNPYDRRTAPGGALKYAVSRWIARIFEPVALRAASGLVAVSQDYIEALRREYPWLGDLRAAAIPFGAPFRDFDTAEATGGPGGLPFDRDDGFAHWVYVGVVAPHMWPVLEALFAALSRRRRADPREWERVRLHFVGTSYASAGAAAEVQRLAARHGVQDVVSEQTARVPYMQALRILRASQGVLVVGSVLGDYTPSKMLLCALSGRPVLALMNARSPALENVRGCRNVRVAAFAASPDEPAYGAVLDEALRGMPSAGDAPTVDVRPELRAQSAEALTRTQCDLLDALVSPRSAP